MNNERVISTIHSQSKSSRKQPASETSIELDLDCTGSDYNQFFWICVESGL